MAHSHQNTHYSGVCPAVPPRKVDFVVYETAKQNGFCGVNFYQYPDAADVKQMVKEMSASARLPVNNQRGRVKVHFDYPLGKPQTLEFWGVKTRGNLAAAIHEGYRALYAADKGGVQEAVLLKDDVAAPEVQTWALGALVIKTATYRPSKNTYFLDVRKYGS